MSLKDQGKQIVDGFTNLIKSKLTGVSPELQAKAEERYAFCKSCEMRRFNMCDPTSQIKHVVTGKYVRGCGCNLAAKVFSPESSCPAGKW